MPLATKKLERIKQLKIPMETIIGVKIDEIIGPTTLNSEDKNIS